ncbi:hypothetical protein GCM10009867_30750 [Pedococcus aerophilus]|uniref:Secreted protein n=1 Tax=Pedococcus aerophilus TaxID=436356 RepID=A0ABN3UU69_9MICO
MLVVVAGLGAVAVEPVVPVDGAVVDGLVVEGAVDDGLVVEGVVAGAVVVAPVVADDDVVADGAELVAEPVDGLVVDALVVVPAGPVGVVVLADARPGVTSVAATARASAAAGRALRMEWYMVPLSASGVATVAPVHPQEKTEPPLVALTTNRGWPRTWWVSGLHPAYLDGFGAASRSRHSGSPPSRAAYGCGSAPDLDRLPLWRVVVSPEGDGPTLHPRRGGAGNPDEPLVPPR